MENTLLLHCGAKHVTLDEVRKVETPAETSTWMPVGHGDFIEMLRDEVTAQGFEIEKEEYGLKAGRLIGDDGSIIGRSNGAKMFGLMTFTTERDGAEWSYGIGFRSALDKSMSLMFALADTMFVCDNMIMGGGDAKYVKKHCPAAMLELPSIIADEIRKLPAQIKQRELTYAAYKEHALDDRDFHHIVCQAIMDRIIPTSKAKKVLQEWDNPRYEAFAPRTMFSGFNAFTEICKETRMVNFPERMGRLEKICNATVELV